MPPRKNAAAGSTAVPERRSTRSAHASSKPKPATVRPAAAAKKVKKKTDPELVEWESPKKRKKADVDVEDDASEEGKPKKKVC
jgi:hypothetical protein